MVYVLYLLAIVCSLLSQLPVFLETGVDDTLKLSWILPVVYLLVSNPSGFVSKRLSAWYIFILVFIPLYYLLQRITGNNYLAIDVYNILICFMVTVVSFTFWQKHAKKSYLQVLARCVLYVSLFLALYVMRNYLVGTSIMDKEYAFDAKNSMSTILLSASVIGLFTINPISRAEGALTYIAVMLLMISVLLIRSRATIIGLLFVVYYLMFRIRSRKIRTFTILLVTVALVVLLLNDSVRQITIEGILFAGRDVGDIDEVSSGRFSQFPILFGLIKQNLMVGIGDYYFDCFPVAMLVQFGLLGSIIVFSFIVYVFRFLSRKVSHDNPICLTAYILFCVFLLNSLFEARPPFGPGIKCFLLWLFFGFSLAENSKIRKKNTMTFVK